MLAKRPIAADELYDFLIVNVCGFSETHEFHRRGIERPIQIIVTPNFQKTKQNKTKQRGEEEEEEEADDDDRGPELSLQ